MIVLRPHHLLCTQGYSGHGYDDAFVEHMNDVVHQLREVPGTQIHLTFSTDTLCSCCPNKLGEDLCDTQEKVKRYDRKTVEYFGLEEKDYVYQDLIRAILPFQHAKRGRSTENFQWNSLFFDLLTAFSAHFTAASSAA